MARYLYHLSTLVGGVAWAAVIGAPISAWWVAVIPYAGGVGVDAVRDLALGHAVARHPAGRQR